MENYEIKKEYQPRKVSAAQKKKHAEMDAEPTTERHQRIRIAPKKVSNNVLDCLVFAFRRKAINN